MSDFEIRKEEDVKTQKMIKAGKLKQDLDDSRQLQTAQDIEDMFQEELSKFKPAPRITEDDKKNNLKSLNRKLDDTLLLICAQKEITGKEVLLLPEAKWTEGETLKQTAERIIKEKCGEDLKVHIYGNAPCGFHKTHYKTETADGAIGSKTFFYRAAYKAGNIDSKTKFEWVTEPELRSKLQPSYFKSVSQFLLT